MSMPSLSPTFPIKSILKTSSAKRRLAAEKAPQAEATDHLLGLDAPDAAARVRRHSPEALSPRKSLRLPSQRLRAPQRDYGLIPLGGSALAGLSVFAYQYVAPRFATTNAAYDEALQRLQRTADAYAKQLGIVPPRIIIHRSWAMANPYQGFNYPALGLERIISFGKQVVDSNSHEEQDCWLGHEIGHFCEGKQRVCDLIEIAPWRPGLPLFERENRADLIGAQLCGQQPFIRTLQIAGEREANTSWTGLLPAMPNKVAALYSTHPPFPQRIDNVRAGSAASLVHQDSDPQILRSLVLYYAILLPLGALMWLAIGRQPQPAKAEKKKVSFAASSASR